MGPYTVEQIQQMLENHQLSHSHQVNDGTQWIFVKEFLSKKIAEAKKQTEYEITIQREAARIAATSAQQPGPPYDAASLYHDTTLPHHGTAPRHGNGGESSNTILYVILTALILACFGIAGYIAATRLASQTFTLVGSWRGTGEAGAENYIFNSDGTFLFESTDGNHSGSWKAGDGILIISSSSLAESGEAGWSYNLDGAILRISAGSKSFTLIRNENPPIDHNKSSQP